VKKLKVFGCVKLVKLVKFYVNINALKRVINLLPWMCKTCKTSCKTY